MCKRLRKLKAEVSQMDIGREGQAPVQCQPPQGSSYLRASLEIGCEAHRTAHLSGPTGRWILTGKKLTIISKGWTGVCLPK